MPPTPEPDKLPRPRQVTLAAALVMGASAMLVLSVFERLGNLRSVDSREAIERFVSEPPGSDLGLGVESVLDLLYVVSMIAAGLGTAAAILGFYVLKRNRSARIGLSLLALPLFVCGLVTGGFLASVVAASVAMLWLTPSRHWFAGTTPGAIEGTRLVRREPVAPPRPPCPRCRRPARRPPRPHRRPGRRTPPPSRRRGWRPRPRRRSLAGPPGWSLPA